MMRMLDYGYPLSSCHKHMHVDTCKILSQLNEI